jgi:hypothetical protein
MSQQIIKQDVPLKHLSSISINSVNNILDKNLRDIIMAIYNHDKIKNTDISASLLENGDTVVSKSYKRLVDIILKSIYDVGFNISEKEQKILAHNLVMEIKYEFGHLTIEEIEIVFKNGSRGIYGDFYGINVRTLHSWVREYISITKAESILKLNSIKQISNKPKELSQEEKNKLRKDWIERVVKDFYKLKNDGVHVHYDLGNILYSFFERNKLFILSKKEKKNIFDNALTEYKRERGRENANSRNQVLEFSTALKRLINNDESEINKVKIKAKHLAIKYIFEKAIKEKIDFEEIIIKACNEDTINVL